MKVLKMAGKVLMVLIVLIVIAGVYLKTALPDSEPAPELKIEQTAERIERGKYLANHVTVCMDCHSTRDWTHYAGPMTNVDFGGGGEQFNQDMGFPGKFYAPNITPYKLGKWTDGEILRAITTGVNKDGKALFPVMAYHRFGQLDQEDIYSIVAYLRQIPSVKKDVPQSEADFPVNFLINTMPQKAAFTKRPSEQDKVAYGKYLITATGCVDCHSKTDKGSVITGTEFGGGMEFSSPGGIVRSPNITRDKKTGLGNWTEDTFVRRFKAYADSNYVSPKLNPGDLNTPMPWAMYAGMKESDLKAIYAYLNTVNPIENQVVKFETKSSK